MSNIADPPIQAIAAKNELFDATCTECISHSKNCDKKFELDPGQFIDCKTGIQIREDMLKASSISPSTALAGGGYAGPSS